VVPIIGTLLLGLVGKVGGDLLVSAAKKLFKSGAPSGPGSTDSFQSALSDARAAQAEAAPPPAAAGTTNFAAIPSTASVAEAAPPAAPPSPMNVAAAYFKVDSIQTA
jgi:hypothetical protein